MKCYELPAACEANLFNKNIRPYVRVAFEGNFFSDKDIIECVIQSYRSVDGGTRNLGDLILDTTETREFLDNYDTGDDVQIWYCYGDNSACFMRFNLKIDDNGIQYEQTGYSKKTCRIHLVDHSKALSDEKKQKNWTESQIVVHLVVCDETQPEKSLVHLLAKRGGFSADDIDCCYLPFNVPYVEITKSAWDELCDLAKCYGASLECSKDKCISFTESPYDTVNKFSDEKGITLTDAFITHYRSYNDNDEYGNSIRLKYTKYSETEKQVLWEFSDSHSWYDEDFNVWYPFTNDSREICQDNYKALYTAKDLNGKVRTVVYAEDIDDKETFEKNIITDGGKKFEIEVYDTTSNRNCAVIKLNRKGENIALGSARIHGKAIISETNFCVYRHDEKEIKKHGQQVKNFSYKYLSNDEIDGVPFYELRANDLLEEYKKRHRSFYVTTYLCLCNVRAGACIGLNIEGKERKVSVDEISFRYKKEEAFSTELWLSEK